MRRRLGGRPRAKGAPSKTTYVLSLFVAGSSPRSVRAIHNVRAFCDQHLARRCRLDVVDVLQDPVLAAQDQIIALPTLLKRSPAPLRRFIGDLSDPNALLDELGIGRS